jgi:hypothetical protein
MSEVCPLKEADKKSQPEMPDTLIRPHGADYKAGRDPFVDWIL